MIFVTTGTQLPFPRLIAAMDALAPSLGEEVVAQVGPDTAPRPNLDLRATLAPAEFAALFNRARVIVAHAGIGTILTAKEMRKPLVLLPRRHALGEHRNDHQLATARQVAALPGVHIAWEAEDIAPLLARSDLAPATPDPGPTAGALIARLRDFVDGRG